MMFAWAIFALVATLIAVWMTYDVLHRFGLSLGLLYPAMLFVGAAFAAKVAYDFSTETNCL
jgi:hypothetical protein